MEIVQVGSEIVRELGITTIQFANGELRCTGRTYTPEEYRLIGSWYTVTLKEEAQGFCYLYRERAAGVQANPVLGCGEVNFVHSDVASTPVKYQASFFDPIHKTAKTVGFGYKIVDPEELRTIETPEGVARVLAKYVKQHRLLSKAVNTQLNP